MLKNVLKLHQCLINYCPTNTARLLCEKTTKGGREKQKHWMFFSPIDLNVQRVGGCWPSPHYLNAFTQCSNICVCFRVLALRMWENKKDVAVWTKKPRAAGEKKQQQERKRKRYWMTKCETVDQRNDTEHQYLKSIARICSLFLLYWICLCGYETPQCVCVCLCALQRPLRLLVLSIFSAQQWYWSTGPSLCSSALLSCPVLTNRYCRCGYKCCRGFRKHNYRDSSVSTKLLVDV